MNQKLKQLLDAFSRNEFQEFKSIKQNDNSWTNLVYEITTKDEEVYFIRIKKHFKNNLEPILMQKLFKHDYFFDLDNANMISVGLNNFNLNVSKPFIDYLIKWIEGLQNNNFVIQQNDANTFLFDEYISLAKSNELSHYFLSLYQQEKNQQQLVLSHNDLSQFNLLIDKMNNYQIIDFEYAAFNLKWWDLFNFMRSLNKKNFQKMEHYLIEYYKFKKADIYKYLFLTTYYAYLWSLNAYQNFFQHKEIKQYSFETYKLSKKFLNKFLQLK